MLGLINFELFNSLYFHAMLISIFIFIFPSSPSIKYFGVLIVSFLPNYNYDVSALKYCYMGDIAFDRKNIKVTHHILVGYIIWKENHHKDKLVGVILHCTHHYKNKDNLKASAQKNNNIIRW